jgi:hypothetical protein
MASKIETFEVRTASSEVAEDQRASCTFETDAKSGKEWAVRTGSVNVYDDDELELLAEAGLSGDHQKLLNQIIVIRAQDAIRQTMRGSASDPQARALAKQVSKAAKASPELMKQIEALLASVKK